MPTDFIYNGRAVGDVAATLLQNNFDVDVLRPWMGENGRTYVTRNGEAVPVANATATLRKDDWKILDDVLVKTAKKRLKVVGALRSAGLEFNIPNGMGKTVLETETVGDIGDAVTSMDGLRRAPGDRPEFELNYLPLPITHHDFHFSARQIAASRSGGSALDTTTLELATRKVVERVEKLHLGKLDSYTFGGGTIYGLTNYTGAMTKTLTNPSSSFSGATILQEVLAMKQQAVNALHYGPYMLFVAPNWGQYLERDYSSSKGDNTVRARLSAIEGIEGIQTADFLENYDMVLVQMTPDVVRVVVGMEMTAIQWESQGGMQQDFKVMTIMVPQLRADQNSRTGIVYGSV